MKRLEDYRGIVDEKILEEIREKAEIVKDRHIVHINSTYQGGGVAEMLSSLVPLMNNIGIATGWRILYGNPEFFKITKSFHNALQGEEIILREDMKKKYLEVNENFSTFTHLNHDLVIIHDPQPLPLIRFYEKKQPWIWRCHVDLSNPNKELWNFLKEFIHRYDLVIVSSEKYKKKDLPVEQRIVYPAINPLSPKNIELSDETIQRVLKEFNIPLDKPLITQISRFDKWKDPEGVIDVFRIIKKSVDARLVLLGGTATDDPEGWAIYEKVKKKAEDLIRAGDVILIINDGNDILVNTLQRVSRVVIQKSIREGFGLTVTEALWKGTPVVASNIGGIPLQIENGVNGFLLDPHDKEGFADRILQLLQDQELARKMGEKGRETVRERFLITRLIKDYLDIIMDLS